MYFEELAGCIGRDVAGDVGTFAASGSARSAVARVVGMRTLTGRASMARKNCGVNRRRVGFTLLELLVVMVIIGLLAAYVAPRYFGELGKSETKAALAQITAFQRALDHYRLDTGHYPNTQQGLNALVVQPEGEPKWQGPYLSKAVPLDPWGRPYSYRSPGEHGEYDLLSYGKDGQPGGARENADVTSW